MPTDIPQCPHCHRRDDLAPNSRRQRRCVCMKTGVVPQLQALAAVQAQPTPLRPFMPVATALAEALTQLGWDGGADIFAGEVRAASGMTLGRVEIVVKPYSAVVAGGGRVANVTPAMFLEAFVESWSKPIKPAQPAAASPAEPVAQPKPAALSEPHQKWERHRTPWDWEKN